MFQALLLDLDNVLRHWDNSPLDALELHHELSPGTFAQVAYEPALLERAITGLITHEAWCDEISLRLCERLPVDTARALVTCWRNSSSTIDDTLLDRIIALSPKTPLVLVTKATTRLSDDLRGTSVAERMTHIINSSEIGVAKPSPGFYAHALQLTGALPSQLLFIDDHRGNIEAARSFGLHAIHHTSPERTLESLRDMLTRPR